jgi:hypothetical protein
MASRTTSHSRTVILISTHSARMERPRASLKLSYYQRSICPATHHHTLGDLMIELLVLGKCTNLPPSPPLVMEFTRRICILIYVSPIFRHTEVNLMSPLPVDRTLPYASQIRLEYLECFHHYGEGDLVTKVIRVNLTRQAMSLKNVPASAPTLAT